MGFFSDLKDDLSQAVNELVPEEELEAALAAEGQAGEQVSADAEAPEMPAADETLESLDLSGMLDKIEEMGVSELGDVPGAEEALVEEALEEEVLQPEPIAEEETAEELTEPEEIIVEEPTAMEAVIEEEEDRKSVV